MLGLHFLLLEQSCQWNYNCVHIENYVTETEHRKIYSILQIVLSFASVYRIPVTHSSKGRTTLTRLGREAGFDKHFFDTGQAFVERVVQLWHILERNAMGYYAMKTKLSYC